MLPAEVVAEVQAGDAQAELPIDTRSKHQGGQQTIVSMIPQSRAGQAAATKLNSKKRCRDDEAARCVGLASRGRCTRSKSAVAA